MPKQILLLCAVVLGVGAEAETKPAGSVVVVDDDIADDLVELVPPAAQLDNSELAETPRRTRTRTKAPAPPPPAGPAGSNGGGGADGSQGGTPDDGPGDAGGGTGDPDPKA